MIFRVSVGVIVLVIVEVIVEVTRVRGRWTGGQIAFVVTEELAVLEAPL